ncbi:zinc-dependent metalloprotease [Labedaea rhizosphaerae]|uniref:Putative hydrolase/coenzyme F420 biosynthesis associated uncharacterized protein n=1 Tax=Labedaea rhizosphaerae TaxID=598644 RepID=A0A4R6SMY7_LABRH|nr:putative hydrolase/coenzyme F420 biosynthesis associated uncharacterized protein [Labedaea rhizosphaerae]
MNADAPGNAVDWSMAVSTAQRLISRGPVIDPEDAQSAVRELRDITTVAEQHVRDLTGLGEDLPLLPGDVVDRHGWVAAAADGLAALTDGALPQPPSGPFGAVISGSAGMQAGLVLAFLSGRVLGQYDPFGRDSGTLLLVAPNVVTVQQALDVPASDFRMWVCLHEGTHRLQFTAHSWLRDYFSGQVREFIGGMDRDASATLGRLPEIIRSVRDRTQQDGTGLMELLQSPEQREVFDRLIALSTLLEGHADHVMDAVGPAVVPSVATIRSRFTARRRGGGLLDRVLRTLLGVEAKVKQYAAGAAFTKHVIDAVGMARFNVIWTSPETLPRRSEIADPDAWLRRVDP